MMSKISPLVAVTMAVCACSGDEAAKPSTQTTDAAIVAAEECRGESGCAPDERCVAPGGGEAVTGVAGSCERYATLEPASVQAPLGGSVVFTLQPAAASLPGKNKTYRITVEGIVGGNAQVGTAVANTEFTEVTFTAPEAMPEGTFIITLVAERGDDPKIFAAATVLLFANAQLGATCTRPTDCAEGLACQCIGSDMTCSLEPGSRMHCTAPCAEDSECTGGFPGGCCNFRSGFDPSRSCLTAEMCGSIAGSRGLGERCMMASDCAEGLTCECLGTPEQCASAAAEISLCTRPCEQGIECIPDAPFDVCCAPVTPGGEKMCLPQTVCQAVRQQLQPGNECFEELGCPSGPCACVGDEARCQAGELAPICTVPCTSDAVCESAIPGSCCVIAPGKASGLCAAPAVCHAADGGAAE